MKYGLAKLLFLLIIFHTGSNKIVASSDINDLDSDDDNSFVIVNGAGVVERETSSDSSYEYVELIRADEIEPEIEVACPLATSHISFCNEFEQLSLYPAQDNHVTSKDNENADKERCLYLRILYLKNKIFNPTMMDDSTLSLCALSLNDLNPDQSISPQTKTGYQGSHSYNELLRGCAEELPSTDKVKVTKYYHIIYQTDYVEDRLQIIGITTFKPSTKSTGPGRRCSCLKNINYAEIEDILDKPSPECNTADFNGTSLHSLCLYNLRNSHVFIKLEEYPESYLTNEFRKKLYETAEKIYPLIINIVTLDSYFIEFITFEYVRKMFKEKKELIQIKDANSFSNIEIRRLKYLMNEITFTVQYVLDRMIVKIEDLTSDWVENFMQLKTEKANFTRIIEESNVDFLFEISYEEKEGFEKFLFEKNGSKFLKLIN